MRFCIRLLLSWSVGATQCGTLVFDEGRGGTCVKGGTCIEGNTAILFKYLAIIGNIKYIILNNYIIYFNKLKTENTVNFSMLLYKLISKIISKLKLILIWTTPIRLPLYLES